MTSVIHDLRAQLTALERRWQEERVPRVEGHADGAGRIALGVSAIDDVLEGGLVAGAVHELWSQAMADMAGLGGFAAGLGRVLQTQRARPVVWVRQAVAEAEAGLLYAPGLVGLGLDPAAIIVVRTKTFAQLLATGLEAARCNAVAAVLLEAWDRSGDLDLTATRRLSLACEASGVTAFITRICPSPALPPSAAMTRWQITACPSQSVFASAPGYPAFDIILQRNRNGRAGQRWRVEWNYDDKRFQQIEPLSGPGVSVSERRSPDMGRPPDGGLRPASAHPESPLPASPIPARPIPIRATSQARNAAGQATR